jgi:predicted alpha/beta-fold hydrolase
LNPLIRNGHLQTLLGNFWARPVTETDFPLHRRLYETEPGVRVAVDQQVPAKQPPSVHAVLVHGLEGSSQSGYIRSLSRDLLEAGIAVHRFNMRSCGGTEHLAPTNYHAGQTSDLLAVLSIIRQENPAAKLLLIGYSLGGNASLKLAGELQGKRGVLDGVCAVSTPIDLAACADQLNRPINFLYQQRFLAALKNRIRRRHALDPARYDIRHLPNVRSIWDFDELYTSKLFGFGTARNYFETQSSGQFLPRIDIPCLLVHAMDDPMIPFEVYRRAEKTIEQNPNIRYVPFEHGGHVGFVGKDGRRRFWIDPLITRWALEVSS